MCVIALVAVGLGSEGISVNGGCRSSYCGNGCEVSSSLSLAFWYCLHLDSSSLQSREKGLIGELGLVLLADPVSGLMVLHCMLQDHDFKHLLDFRKGEPAFGDEVTDALG